MYFSGSMYDIDLETLPDLEYFPSARKDCKIGIKTKAFTENAERLLKEVGFSMTSAIEKQYGQDITVFKATFSIVGDIQEEPRSHDCFFDDSIINEFEICSDRQLRRKYQEYLSQYGEYVGNYKNGRLCPWAEFFWRGRINPQICECKISCCKGHLVLHCGICQYHPRQIMIWKTKWLWVYTLNAFWRYAKWIIALTMKRTPFQHNASLYDIFALDLLF